MLARLPACRPPYPEHIHHAYPLVHVGAALAQALAGAPANIEYFYDGVWNAAPPPPGKVRDGLGTTHHEAGTLWMGTDPNASVVNLDGRFHNL